MVPQRSAAPAGDHVRVMRDIIQPRFEFRRLFHQVVSGVHKYRFAVDHRNPIKGLRDNEFVPAALERPAFFRAIRDGHDRPARLLSQVKDPRLDLLKGTFGSIRCKSNVVSLIEERLHCKERRGASAGTRPSNRHDSEGTANPRDEIAVPAERNQGVAARTRVRDHQKDLAAVPESVNETPALALKRIADRTVNPDDPGRRIDQSQVSGRKKRNNPGG